MTTFAEGNEHPQGDKTFNGKIHQCFGHQNITQVKGGKAETVHRTSIEDGLYEPEADYTTRSL
jgi:branched-chain amino acid transport system substrate-binding protein